MESDASKTKVKKINLKQSLLPTHIPPRPHTHQFTQITIMLDGGKNPIFKFSGDYEIRIGRQVEEGKIRWNNLDLSIFDDKLKSVSRRHCRIYREDDNIYLEDLGSRNGTWVNACRILPKKPTPLSSKDYIQVGQIGFWIYLPRFGSAASDDDE